MMSWSERILTTIIFASIYATGVFDLDMHSYIEMLKEGLIVSATFLIVHTFSRELMSTIRWELYEMKQRFKNGKRGTNKRR